jgi:hypothetical protein
VHVHFAVQQAESDSGSSRHVRKGTPYPTRGRLSSEEEQQCVISEDQITLDEGRDLAAAAAATIAAHLHEAVSVRFVIAGGRQGVPAATAAAGEEAEAFVRHDTPHPCHSRPSRAGDGSQGEQLAAAASLEPPQASVRDMNKRTPGSAGEVHVVHVVEGCQVGPHNGSSCVPAVFLQAAPGLCGCCKLPNLSQTNDVAPATELSQHETQWLDARAPGATACRCSIS